MYPDAPPARTPLPRAPIVAAGALTALVSAVGLLPWPRPFLAGTTESRWNVSGVPGAMWALVLGTATVCVAVGAVLTFRLTGLRPWQPTALGWLLLAVLAVAPLVGAVGIAGAMGRHGRPVRLPYPSGG